MAQTVRIGDSSVYILLPIGGYGSGLCFSRFLVRIRAVWLHARTVAANAAAAVADLRVMGASQDSAAREAGRRIADNGGLQDVSIGLAAHSDVLVVTVSGRAPLFFDLGQGRIAETAVLPLEKVAR